MSAVAESAGVDLGSTAAPTQAIALPPQSKHGPSPASRLLWFRLADGAQSAPALPLLARHARNAGTVRRLETHYFDTPDRLLFGNDLSLRVRRHGRRFTQRLSLRDRSGQTTPASWDWQVGGDDPDLACLGTAELDGVGQPLAERLGTALLAPVFATRLRRHIRRLDLPDAVIDLVLDTGIVQAAGRAGAETEPLGAIGLVLRSGDAGTLFEIGARLLEAGGLHVDPQGVVERGYALASSTPMRARKAVVATIATSGATPDAAPIVTDDMIARILLQCLAHMQSNQPIARDGRNPDGVHQMRVALRRLRSVLSLVGREVRAAGFRHFAAEAKWAADELGDARGWDVLLSTTIAEPARRNRSGADFALLRQAAEGPRTEAYARVSALLDSARHDRFQLALAQWIARRGWRNEVDHAGLALLAEPAETMAAGILSRLRAKALRQGHGFKRLSAHRRHELRITAKKLRYAAEFFLPLWGEPKSQTRRFMRQLAVLQEALGLDQDAATTQPLLEVLARTGASPGLHQAIGMIAGWQTRALLDDDTAALAAWRRFRALPGFWPALPAPAG